MQLNFYHHLNILKKKYINYVDDKCIFTKDYKELLEIDNLNLVIIASYDNYHYEQIIQFSKKKIITEYKSSSEYKNLLKILPDIELIDIEKKDD